MKYSYLNSDELTKFILSYEVKDDEIIAKLASGEYHIIPYTLENEKKVLKIMKLQVCNSKNVVENRKERFEKFSRKSMFWFCLSVVALSLACSSEGFMLVYNGVVTVLCCILSTGYLYFTSENKKIVNDIEKNLYFLDNEVELNAKVRSNNNILSNVSQKTKDLVESTPAEKQVFTINSIDNIPYSDLIKIEENTKREEYFGFDYSEEKGKQKVKVLLK